MMLAFTLAALMLSGQIRKGNVWEIIVLATLLGTVNAFDVPARQSFLIEMVGRENLLNAIALNSSMFNGARVAGPAIAAAVVAVVGEGWCFLLNGVSYLAVIAGLFMMRIEKTKPVHDGAAPLEKLREGFRFARHTKPIRALLALLGVVSFMALPFSVLIPIFAVKILHGGVNAYGWLMGAVGFGAMFGALAIAMRQQLRGLGNVVAFSAAGLGVSLVLFSASRWFLLSFVMLVFCGFSDDDAVYRHQHAHSGDGAGAASRARDVVVRHDVFGNVASRLARCRQAGGPHRRADDGRDRRLRQLPRRIGLCAQVALHARPGARPHRRARHDGARATSGRIGPGFVNMVKLVREVFELADE